jgi:hypothetical protein
VDDVGSAFSPETRAQRAPRPKRSEVLGATGRSLLGATARELLDASASEPPVDRLQRAWDVEPGYSETAIVNAVTRAAHTEERRSWTTAEDLERAAGQLLDARVWNVQRPAGDVL